MKKKTLQYLFYIWLIILLVFNFFPNLNKKINDVNNIFQFRLDYVFHFMFYFSGIFLFWQWKFESYYKDRKGIIVLFFIMWLLFSSSNEYCQHYIPGRSYNPVDMLMNLMGVVAASVISYVIFALKLKKVTTEV